MIQESLALLLVFAWAVTGCGADADAPVDAAGMPRDGDAALPDASSADASLADANVDVEPVDPPWLPPDVTLPDPESGEELWLSEVGLYVDIVAKEVAPDLIHFAPDTALWTDGALKERWLRLPEGTRIDSSDMDGWLFPIGTMAFKQFVRDGKRIETRLIARVGPGRFDYWMGAFIWNDDETDALFTPDGAQNARGTQHDVPNTTKCGACHNGAAGRILGFSAVQQSATDNEGSLSWLVDNDLLSDPPLAGERYPAPGPPEVAAALGYLHANCGHCHNPMGSARPDTDMMLYRQVAHRTPEQTHAYTTTLNIPLQYFGSGDFEMRVVPGDPDASAVVFRMMERGTRTQMPTIGTELAHVQGLSIVRTWVASLTP